MSWAALLATLIWGGSFPVAKYALASAGPLTLLVFRDTLGAAIILAGSALSGAAPRLRRSDLKAFALLSVTLTVLHQGVQVVGMVFTTATNTSWLIASSPIFVALLAHVLLGERLVGRQWVGMVFGLAGAAVMVTAGAGGSFASGPHLGDLLVVGSAVAWGLYSTLGKQLLGKYRPTLVSGYGLAMGMGVVVPVWLALGGPDDLGKQTAGGWVALLYLAVPATAIAHWLWYRAMRRLPAGVVGAYMFLPPLVATLLGRIWLGEPLPWPTVLGALLILGGVALVTWRNSPEDAR